jgi:hypothetical protein
MHSVNYDTGMMNEANVLLLKCYCSKTSAQKYLLEDGRTTETCSSLSSIK